MKKILFLLTLTSAFLLGSGFTLNSDLSASSNSTNEAESTLTTNINSPSSSDDFTYVKDALFDNLKTQKSYHFKVYKKDGAYYAYYRGFYYELKRSDNSRYRYCFCWWGSGNFSNEPIEKWYTNL